MTRDPDPHAGEAHETSVVPTPDIETAHTVLRERLAAELREAALRARGFACHLKSQELKDSFLRLAAKWEAEAQALDAKS